MCDALRKGWWGGNWGDLFTYTKKREKSIARKIKEIATVLKAKRKRKENKTERIRDKSLIWKKIHIVCKHYCIGNIRIINFLRLLILWKIIKYTYATIWKKKILFNLPISPSTYNKFYFFLLPHLIRFIFTGNELWFFFYLQKKTSEYKDMRKSKEKHWNLSGEQ